MLQGWQRTRESGVMSEIQKTKGRVLGSLCGRAMSCVVARLGGRCLVLIEAWVEEA